MEEPDLNYWQPESLTSLPSTPNYSSCPDLSYMNTFETCDTLPPENLSPTFQSCSSMSEVPVPLPEYLSSSLLQNSYEFTQTQVPSFAYPTFDVDNYPPKQDNQRIQDEVTRAAKTLFKKRNRTLMSWLNPGLSKAHLKFDTNSAWDNLPQSGKDVFVAQVLGKLAPYASSLMVNPSLKPSDQPVCEGITPVSRDYQTTPNPPVPRIPRQRKPREKKLDKQKPMKRKVVYLVDDENSSDYGLVVDMSPKQTSPKRKYTRRKQREKPVVNTNEGECSSASSCGLSVEEKEVDSKPIPKNKEDPPRVKRKYTKRKLVRKAYTRRTPNKQCCEPAEEKVEIKEELVDSSKDSDDVDLWVELGNDDFCKSIEMMTEDVDSFWETIEDPNNLFVELDIE